MLPLIPCFGAISDGNPDEQALALCRAGFWGHIYFLHCPSVQNLWTNKSVQYTVRDSFANMVSVKVNPKDFYGSKFQILFENTATALILSILSWKKTPLP